MRNRLFSAKFLFVLFALTGFFLMPTNTAFGQGQIIIVNTDGPNEGFNDPTPAAPVGGNTGTTVGQQRLIAFQYAANIWESKIKPKNNIYIQSAFNPLSCTATAATLGAAGAIQIFANFPGREFDNTWYHVALANQLAGADLAPGLNGTSADDIIAQFNSNLGNPGCLTGVGWYYGLDANHGSKIDLVAVLLHEFGHGIGFANFVTETTGTSPLGLGDIYSEYTRDVNTGKKWNGMTNAERQASAINTNKVVWDGINVSGATSGVLTPGTPYVTVNSPASLGSPYRVGLAQFGPALTSPGVTADVVQALDPADVAGPTTFDACSPLTNAGAVAGKIALVDRGTCGFVVKVKNAQNAGAIGVIIADNAAGSPPAGMGGVDPTITIPSVRISLPNGNAIKTELGFYTVNATIGINLAVRQGAEPVTGLALLNAPNPIVSGSSISHWDPIASPNQLMEPSINGDLTHSVEPPQDLTLKQLTDIGWFSDNDGVPDGVDECIGSSPSPTVVIDGCDSGVPNTVFPNGCKISDKIAQIAASASNHGQFASRVAQYLNQLVKQGVITGAQKDAIQSCAGQAALP